MRSIVYRKRDRTHGNGTVTTVRLSPTAKDALQGITARFSQAYPPDQYPSLAVIFETVLTRFADELNGDARKLKATLAQMQRAGYPVTSHKPV